MKSMYVVVPVMAGLLAGFALWAPRSEAKKCTGPKFTCDAPEGCEFRNQMTIKYAYKAVFDDEALAAQAIANAKKQLAAQGTKGPSAGVTAAEYESMVQKMAGPLLEKAAADGALSLRVPACKGSTVADPPGMTTLPPDTGDDPTKCKVVFSSGKDELPIDQLYAKNPNACDEIMDASRVHEMLHVKKHCDPKSQTARLDDIRAAEHDGYTIEIHYLRDDMAAVGQWCTPSKKHRKRFGDKARRATMSALKHQKLGGK